MNTSNFTSEISFKDNRKIKIFLFFLVLTCIIWLLIELSKTYTSTAVFNVKYINLPESKLLQNEPVSELEIALRAPGFSLVSYKARKHTVTLSLNSVAKQNNNYYILPNMQRSLITEQLPSDVEAVNVLTDTVFIELGINISKKVPVVADLDVKFKLGYNYVDNLKVTPDSVVISGPEKDLDTIFEIQTKQLKIDEAFEDVNSTLELIVPSQKENIVLSPYKVAVFGEVDKFTEGSFKIPVRVINEPNGVKINPFPKEVEVVFQVALSNFNKISENSISIVYDYNEYKLDTLKNYLSPVIQQKSKDIYSYKLNPQKIEFLIEK